MASITAAILIGSSPTSNDGIVPTHSLFLSENSRPALILSRLDKDDKRVEDDVIWIPTIDNLMEDIMLMISINVLKDMDLKDRFIRLRGKESGQVELASLNQDGLQGLYGLNKGCLDSNNNFKIIFSVFDGSTLQRQLAKLKDYSMDIEVCPSSYIRQYQPWQDKIYKKGNL